MQFVLHALGLVSSFKTKGGHRRYSKASIISKLSNVSEIPQRKICYCRVSSASQKKDLERQVKFFRRKYPEHEIVRDIGSGLNFKRKGLNTILESAISGNIKEVVVTHRDRLCRFSFDFFERIISRYSNGKIVVLNQKETSPQEELVNDLLSIITVFSSRLYGLRSHALKNKIKNSASKNPKNETLSDTGGKRTTSDDDGPIQVVL